MLLFSQIGSMFIDLAAGTFSNIEGRSATQRESISKNNISLTGSMDSIKHHILKQFSKYLIFGLTSVDFHHPYTRLQLFI